MNANDLGRRHVGAIVAAAFGALAFPAIARATERVRIGYQKNGSLVILRQQHRLDSLNLAVEWVEFTSGPPILEALNAGAIDFGATGDTPPIFAQAAGAELLYVGGQPISGASEALLVPSDSPIDTLVDLRGKRIAFTKGSSAHNFLIKALARADLKPADIQPVYLQPADAGAAFRTGAVDAWAIWDPFFALAQREPTTRVLTTAEGVAPTNSFFLASRDFAERAPATISTLLDAINAVAAWGRENPDALASTMADVTGVPLAVERVAAPRGVYAVQSMDDTIIGQQQSIADTFAALRIIPSRIDIRSAVWRPALQRAEVSR
jgi:aliphatic sulfonates family ABC transporter substrate-binding protein